MPQVQPPRLVIGAIAAAAMLALSACGTSEPSPSATEGGDSDRNATIALGVQAPPNSLDPAQLHDGTQRYVWSTLYDTLIYSNNEGKLEPAAAESWQYSEDALTLTMKLRDDLKFSDGDPVTSAAVKATLERTKNTPGPQQSNLAAVDSVEAPDERTAVLRLKRPDPNLLVALSYGSGVIGDPDTLADPSRALNPVASGPYVLNTDKTIAGTTYVLERRDDHWNADAYPFKTVTIRAIADRTALFNALLTGELDAGTVDGTQAEQAKGGGLNVKPVDSTAIAELVLADRAGTVTPELADVRVRKAINMALDKEGVVKAILRGNGKTTNQVFNEFSPAYDPKLDDVYSYDREAARKLLAEAGYPDGFKLVMPANLPSLQYQPTISQLLGDIGIKVEWEPVPATSAGQNTKWGAYWNIGGTAAATRTAAVYYRSGGSQNPFKSTDPKLDKLFQQLDAETDTKRQGEILRDINEFGVQEAWFAPVFSQTTLWATQPGFEYVGSGVSLFDLRAFGTSNK
ncbi:ABC transporter substrate-binding protein [Arthrobacter sp. B6]|uniref:ABC transporter substrate-binding protein n=1 Tax=Arthrobacter sp. B6 TaxID=1570137 RepID=UPI000B1503D1|nr:ABC transporter substrate-binding protein [Arthrobacter sp. B6]